MSREFIQGYLFSVSGLPYENDQLQCCINTEHSFLCFGDDGSNPIAYVISESDELDVIDGAKVTRLEPKIGYYEDDGSASFVVVQIGRSDRCVVAAIW